MIKFELINVSLPVLDEKKITLWVHDTAALFDKKVGKITYIFCDDEQILKLNKLHLQHDYYTDIISFDNSKGSRISGEIFISLDTVTFNANKYKVDFEEELLRVMIHGILHFCGLKDDTEEAEKNMRTAENRALSHYKQL